MLRSIGSIISLFSILLFLLINQPILAQVEIEEEIILESSLSIEGQSLIMPFYGKITGCVNWGAMWWGWLKDVVIESGGQSVRMGFGCGAGYTYCTWAITNVPSSNAVQVTVYGSCENGVLIEAETQTVQTGANEYEVQYKYNGNWSMATTIQFTATTPSGCGDGPECNTEIPIPKLLLNDPLPHNDLLNDPCSNEPSLIAYSRPSNKNMALIYITDFCFNKQTQLWEFKINDGNIRYNWVIDYCESNLPSTVNLLDGVWELPASYSCDELKNDIKLHLEHLNPNANWPNFFFKPLLRIHEMGHFLHFEDAFYKPFKFIFDGIWKKEIKYRCNDFNSSETQITAIQNKIYKDVLAQYLIKVVTKWKINETTDIDFENWIDKTYLKPVIEKYLQDIDADPQNYNCIQ